MKPSTSKIEKSPELSGIQVPLNLTLLQRAFGKFVGSHQDLDRLSQNLETTAFQLGDTLTNSSEGLENTVQNLPIPPSLYLVLQGKVRLISWEHQKQREVPVQVLTEGESFGGDSQFQEPYLT